MSNWAWIILFCVSKIFFVLQTVAEIHEDGIRRIAIVGSGIGGSTSSYFIKKMLNDKVSVTVFESNDRTGGRLRHYSSHNGTFEVGASIIYSGNQHLAALADELNLTKIPPGAFVEGETSLGIWDGRAFTFMKYPENRFMKILRALWRYGTEILQLRSIVSEGLDKFTQIYQLQSNGTAFRSAEELWEALGMLELTEKTILDYLSERIGSQSPLIVKELVFAANKGNYGQGLEMNALAGIVSLCPMVTGQLFCIKEGNAELTIRLLQASQAEVLLGTPVHSVHMLNTPNGKKYTLMSSSGQHSNFDAVIIATPMTTASPSLHFYKDDQLVQPENSGRDFQTIHTTYLEGKIKTEYFKTDPIPTAILLAESGAAVEPFNSIQALYQISDDTKLYKIFSRNKMASDELHQLFEWQRIVDYEEWKAVPLHEPNEKGLPKIIPFAGERIYYINALEDAVSALEISTIASKNIAFLLHEDLKQQQEECQIEA